MNIGISLLIKTIMGITVLKVMRCMTSVLYHIWTWLMLIAMTVGGYTAQTDTLGMMLCHLNTHCTISRTLGLTMDYLLSEKTESAIKTS
jgi:hypothetical protein